jgi:hypothetical protein
MLTHDRVIFAKFEDEKHSGKFKGDPQYAVVDYIPLVFYHFSSALITFIYTVIRMKTMLISLANDAENSSSRQNIFLAVLLFAPVNITCRRKGTVVVVDIIDLRGQTHRAVPHSPFSHPLLALP